MNLTDEQTNIVAKTKQMHSDLKIKAFAGTGKTTTLREIAQAMRSSRFLYLAFSKGVQVYAQSTFPDNVHCQTAHSLAYRAMNMWNNQHRLHDKMTAKELIDLLHIEKIDPKTPYQVLSAIKDLTRSYFYSADEHPLNSHLPKIHFKKISKTDKAQFSSYVHDKAIRYLELMGDNQGNVPMTHDYYLKQWQLSHQSIKGFDVILFDEAQDANPVMLDIVAHQSNVQKIYVGDPHQQIYEWRGAVNAMEEISCVTAGSITKSFRFGMVVADLANTILTKKREVLKIKGMGVESRIVPKISTYPYCVLCRTNVGCIEKAIELLTKNIKSIAIIGDFQAMLEHVESAYWLWVKHRDFIKSDDVRMYTDWKDYCQSVAADEDPEMAITIRLVDKYKTELYDHIKLLKKIIYNKHETVKVVISTAHKAKGLEWDRVEIYRDFESKFENSEGEKTKEVEASEVNLIYVAVTRARRELAISERLIELLS